MLFGTTIVVCGLVLELRKKCARSCSVGMFHSAEVTLLPQHILALLYPTLRLFFWVIFGRWAGAFPSLKDKERTKMTLSACADWDGQLQSVADEFGRATPKGCGIMGQEL